MSIKKPKSKGKEAIKFVDTNYELTPQDKFHLMAKKNESLTKLLKNFNLQFT